MEDNDLLMMAAKAAGIEAGVIHQRPHRRCPEGWTPWNPLRDDGDAFRLAAALRLDMTFRAFGEDEVMVSDSEDRFPGWFSDPYEGDPAAALRRSIVRGAAAVAGAPDA